MTNTKFVLKLTTIMIYLSIPPIFSSKRFIIKYVLGLFEGFLLSFKNFDKKVFKVPLEFPSKKWM
jgi:hypothetical protein